MIMRRISFIVCVRIRSVPTPHSYGVVGGALRLGSLAGAGLPELAVVLGAFEPDAAEAAVEAESVALPGLTLDAGFMALIPAPLGTSEPDGPGTEPPAGAPLPAPMFPLAAPDAPAYTASDRAAPACAGSRTASTGSAASASAGSLRKGVGSERSHRER